MTTTMPISSLKPIAVTSKLVEQTEPLSRKTPSDPEFDDDGVKDSVASLSDDNATAAELDDTTEEIQAMHDTYSSHSEAELADHCRGRPKKTPVPLIIPSPLLTSHPLFIEVRLTMLSRKGHQVSGKDFAHPWLVYPVLRDVMGTVKKA
ncbi:hypothetical protein PAXINDRAFT_155135 [Paxillus involutus ATCC 200175]|nr:hypothetical protein PAXINDRAFT_155135 [Paxillus involutus ATCC 200175]